MREVEIDYIGLLIEEINDLFNKEEAVNAGSFINNLQKRFLNYIPTIDKTNDAYLDKLQSLYSINTEFMGDIKNFYETETDIKHGNNATSCHLAYLVSIGIIYYYQKRFHRAAQSFKLAEYVYLDECDKCDNYETEISWFTENELFLLKSIIAQGHRYRNRKEVDSAKDFLIEESNATDSHVRRAILIATGRWFNCLDDIFSRRRLSKTVDLAH